MTKLNDYLITEGRGKSIKMDEAHSWIINNCKQLLDWMKRGRFIARSVGGKTSSKYWMVDPKKASEPRISANTFNYYTLIMDNESNWGRFPKRSQSLICLTDGYDYGRDEYLIFPKDGWRVGNTNERDLWAVADKIDERIPAMDDWARMVHQILNFNEPNALGSLKKYDKSVQMFKSRCKEFDDHVKDFSKQETYNFIIIVLGHEWEYNDMNHAMAEDYDGDLYRMFKRHIDPNRLGVNIVKSGSGLTAVPDMTEIWTDSPCVMINGVQWQKDKRIILG